MNKKAPVHNHITNQYSLEIDYEKLADAIIKAQSTNTETLKSELPSTEKPLIKKIILFIQLMTIPETLKRRKDLSGTIVFLSSFSAIVMGCIGLFLDAVSLAMVASFFQIDIVRILGINTLYYAISIPIIYIFGILLRVSAQEISRTEDLAVVLMIFTSVVSFVAMLAAVATVVISLLTGGVV